ncbi:DoxX family protein [Paenibacillus gorillae]|uniref:DoxX family protein n=1 Tax=Paenibacillus gorillae TaxID=1243662 RepID=UPI0004B38A73|nr:DoxX family protein [Paenibacillus gorillae]
MEIVAIVLQSLLAFAFLFSGISKVAGVKMQVESFNHLRLPQWFRVITGLVQLVSVAALIIGYWEPSWTAAGALLLSLVAIGGFLAHVRAGDPFKNDVPIVVLGVIAIVLFLLRLSELSSFPGFN